MSRLHDIASSLRQGGRIERGSDLRPIGRDSYLPCLSGPRYHRLAERTSDPPIPGSVTPRFPGPRQPTAQDLCEDDGVIVLGVPSHMDQGERAASGPSPDSVRRDRRQQPRRISKRRLREVRELIGRRNCGKRFTGHAPIIASSALRFLPLVLQFDKKQGDLVDVARSIWLDPPRYLAYRPAGPYEDDNAWRTAVIPCVRDDPDVPRIGGPEARGAKRTNITARVSARPTTRPTAQLDAGTAPPGHRPADDRSPLCSRRILECLK